MEERIIDCQTEESFIEREASYEPPRIEVLEVLVEKGFADSSTGWENGGSW